MATIGVVWAVVGVFGLIGYAWYRLLLISWEAFAHPFSWYHWPILFAHVAFMAYSEGYRGFQKKFSPRVAARIQYLAQHPRFTLVALAPLFAMGYFCASKRTRIATYSLTIAIVLLVMAIRVVPQPWRGIIDAGVVVGLSWGLASLSYFCIRAWENEEFTYDAEVPEAV